MKTIYQFLMQFMFCLLFFPFIIQAQNQTGTFTDSRDNKTYSWVKIGEQSWMSQNVNFVTKKSKCYKDSLQNCDKYGRLYNWKEAKTVCPQGWHLPEQSDFQKLLKSTQQEMVLDLKSELNWQKHKGTNKLGFNAQPCGLYNMGKFVNFGENAFFWTSDTDPVSMGMLAIFFQVNDGYGSGGGGAYSIFPSTGKQCLMSIRCVKD